MQKPMTKTSVKALCRLVELLKVGHCMRTVDRISCVFKKKGGGKGGSRNDEMGNLNEEVVLHGFFFKTGFVQEDWKTGTDLCNL